MGLIRNNQKAFGLDISDLVLRAIKLKKQGRNASFEAYSTISVPEGVMKNGEILQPKILADTLKKLMSKTKYGHFTSKRVVASLPERKSFIKVIDVPRVDNQQLEETVEWEATQHIPYSKDEVYLDWRVLKAGAASDTLKVLINAIPKSIADSYTSVLESAGLDPIALVIESVAIAQSVIAEQNEATQSALVIDLGLHRTSFLIFDRGMVRMSASNKNISGQAMTKLVADKLKLSIDQAEDAKRLCGLDPTRGRAAIPKILEPSINELSKQILKILNYYQTHYPTAQQIQQIFLVGGGANLRDITKSLSSKTKLQVALGDPWANCKHLSKNKVISNNQRLSHPTVIGLALIGNSQELNQQS